MIIELVSNEWR